jgi:ABC-2 type transport system ATP-binding protein
MRVEVKSLTRRFGKVIAVDEASFCFASGEICGFIGPNGAGKTTTMRILATLDQPDCGDAWFDGVSVSDDPEQIRRLVGFMPDSLPTQRDITVHDYLDFFARAHRLRGSHRDRVVDSIQEFTGLTATRERNLSTLSKGMKQRLSMARALIHDPEVLILDEPAAGLDPRARVELRDLLRALAGQGKAILVSSHILGELGEICSSTVIIESGRIVRAGSLADIINEGAPGHAVLIRALEREDELARFLLEQPEVEDVRPSAAGLEVALTGDEATCSDLLRRMIEAGFRIVEHRLRESDLEAVFLKVTQGELQ